jgi:hypothetical protein
MSHTEPGAEEGMILENQQERQPAGGQTVLHHQKDMDAATETMLHNGIDFLGAGVNQPDRQNRVGDRSAQKEQDEDKRRQREPIDKVGVLMLSLTA